MIDFSSGNWNADERTLSVKRFERALENGNTLFLDMDVYEQILDYYHEIGDYQKALELCTMVQDLYSYSATVLADKAKVLSFLGRLDEALRCINEATFLQPTDPEILIIKAHICADAEHHREAITLFEQLLHMGTEDQVSLYAQMGMAYQTLKEFERAGQAYRQALAIEPDYEEALIELSYCYEQLDRLEETIPFYDVLIDQNPFSYFAWFHLGKVYHKLDRFKEAAQAFEYATLIEPNRRAFFWMGHAHMNQQQYEAAFKAYREAVRDEDQATADMFCHVGASLEELERYDEALRYFYKAAKADKYHAPAWYGIGCCLAKQERWYEATHYFGKAVRLDEENTDFLVAKGKAEYQIGNVVSSMEAYEQAIHLNAQNPDAWLDWSLLLYEQGQYQEAADLLESALDEFPENTKVMYRLVAFLMLSGRYREALRHLEIALLLNYDAHEEMYPFFPNLEAQKSLFQLVQRYRT